MHTFALWKSASLCEHYPLTRFSLWQFNNQVHTVIIDEINIPVIRLMILDSADKEHSDTDGLVIDCLV